MAVLYWEPFSGLSGDMVVGALLDLGVPFEFVEESVRKMQIPGLAVRARRTLRRGVGAVRFEVDWDSSKSSVHRHLPEILHRVQGSGLEPAIRDMAARTLKRLAQVEAAVHDQPLSEVHLHEVGAEDSIADIVAASAAWAWLKPQKVVVGPVNVGAGFVEGAHGRYPVPGPATLALLEGFTIYQEGPRVELTTPTGAALAGAMGIPGSLPMMTVHKVGYGAGSQELSHPNVLRVVWGEEIAVAAQ